METEVSQFIQIFQALIWCYEFVSSYVSLFLMCPDSNLSLLWALKVKGSHKSDVYPGKTVAVSSC
jgi:hypothetical protein